MDEGVGVLPSPNWYGAHLADWAGGEALCAYAARNSVLLLRPLSQRVAGTLTGHPNRVTALVFLRATGLQHLLLTGCADRAVRLWDTSTLRCVRTLRGHGAEVTAVAAAPHESEHLGVSADRAGVVLLWRATGDTPVHVGPTLDSPVVCLAMSPVHAGLAAAGCASGGVALLDVATGALVKRLAAHTGDVHAVVFARLPGGGALMATGGRDRAVHLWHLAGGVAAAPVMRSTVNVPKAGPSVSEAQRERLWLALAWLPQRPDDGADQATTFQLAGSGYGGDVMVWDVSVQPQGLALTVSPPHKLGPTAAAHTRTVFTIAAGVASGRRLALSISMDRGVALWDVDAMAQVWMLSGLGGFVYALATSALCPGHIAVGCGDKTIRVWEPAAEGSVARSSLLWKGIAGKVLALAFHPQREGVLAFGTEEGRVGVYDVFAQAHVVHDAQHNAPIMALCWRQLPGGSSTARLCSLAADGQLWEWRAALEPSVASRAASERVAADAAVQLDEQLMSSSTTDDGAPGQITTVAWAPDGALLAVGRERGAMEVWRAPGAIDTGWACVTRLWGHAKGITCVRWHLAAARGARRLLSAAGDGTLCAYEVAPDGAAGAPVSVQAHRRGVQDAAWSPHADTLLATSSIDGTARVWDVASPAAPLAVLRGHDGRVLALCWSALRGDVLFTGAEDQTVRGWHWADARHAPREAPPEAAAPDAADAKAPDAPAEKAPRRKRPASAPKALLSAPAGDATPQGRQALLDACAVLGQSPARAAQPTLPSLPLAQESALSLLLVEERRECAAAAASATPSSQSRAAERAATLALFRGDVGTAAEVLIANDALSADFVSAAAGAGHAAWAHLAAAYATQLEARGEPHAAAVQWLALHDVHAALAALRRGGLARDALVLGTARLMRDDPLLPVLRAELGAAEESAGAWESASAWYAAAGQPHAVARALQRRAGRETVDDISTT